MNGSDAPARRHAHASEHSINKEYIAARRDIYTAPLGAVRAERRDQCSV